MNSPYNHSPGHPGRISPPAGDPNIRRGDTITYVDPAGNYSNERPESGGYLVPSGLAAKAARDAEERANPTPTVVDALKDDATPPDYPEGCPEFVPLYQLDFAQRAEAFDLFDAIQTSMSSMPKKNEQVTPGRAAEMYRVLAKLDEFLSFVAVDPEVYREWPGRRDDAVFGQTWAAYQSRMQPGEAERSSS